MTEADLLDDARALVAKWQPRLRLGGWRILVRVAESSKDNWAAEVSATWRDRKAVVTIPPDHPKRQHASSRYDAMQTDARLLEESVLHELLHVTEYPLADLLNSEITWAVGSDGVAGAAARDLWRDYRECWINNVVDVLLDAETGWR